MFSFQSYLGVYKSLTYTLEINCSCSIISHRKITHFAQNFCSNIESVVSFLYYEVG